MLGLLMLSFGLVTGESATSTVEFSTGSWSCSEDSSTASWRVYSGANLIEEEPIINSSGDVGNCFAHVNETGRSCCPGNLICINETDGNGNPTSRGVCQATADYCFQLTTHGKTACESAEGIGENSIGQIGNSSVCGLQLEYTDPSAGICFDKTSCECRWDEDQCVPATVNKTESCVSNGGIPNSIDTCSWIADETKTVDNCDNPEQNIIIYYNPKWESTNSSKPAPESCNKERSVEYSCTTTVKLPFFNLFGFLLSGVAIVGIYFWLGRKH